MTGGKTYIVIRDRGGNKVSLVGTSKAVKIGTFNKIARCIQYGKGIKLCDLFLRDRAVSIDAGLCLRGIVTSETHGLGYEFVVSYNNANHTQTYVTFYQDDYAYTGYSEA